MMRFSISICRNNRDDPKVFKRCKGTVSQTTDQNQNPIQTVPPKQTPEMAGMSNLELVHLAI